MAEPQSLAAQHSAEVWAALGGSVTVIGVLITALWSRQNNDIKAQGAQLDAGQKAFSAIGEQLVKIGEQIKALEKENEFTGEEFDRLGTDIKILDHDLTVLKTEHKNCREKK